MIADEDIKPADFREKLAEYKIKITEKPNSGVTNDLEENGKNEFNSLLKSVFSYEINTHGSIDSVIRDENKDIRVIIEVKNLQTKPK